MQNPMDSMGLNPIQQTASPIPNNFQNVIQQALQNPKAFEEYIKHANPQAYQHACSIRNAYGNGNIDMRTAVMQLAQARGINPSVLSALGLK